MSQEALRDSHEKFVNLLSSVVNEIKVRVISTLHSGLQRKSCDKSFFNNISLYIFIKYIVRSLKSRLAGTNLEIVLAQT